MSFFAWNSDLSIGCTAIDNDHRHLIDLLNNLFDAMDKGKGRVAAGAVLNNLVQYAAAHFKREEDLMQSIGYAEFVFHKAEHDKLRKTVLEQQAKLNAGQNVLTLDLLMFLSNWLFDHIVHVDKKLGRALEAAKADKS